jgi:transcriptional regulator GlxA family with amidase domain
MVPMPLIVVSTLFLSTIISSSNSVILGLPLNYGIILYPGFEVLDVFGPFDFLNRMSSDYPMNLHIIASTMRPVSSRHLTPADNNTAHSNFSESVVPSHTFKHPPYDLDVLFVPGGTGSFAEPPELLDAIEYIKDTYPKLQYLISVCTGAALLARAGVLDGRRATTNKASWAWVTPTGPRVNWVPTARWVVDGNIWTTSGVAAGMDGMLGFIEHLYGSDIAWKYANLMEYEWHNNSTWDPFAAIFNVTGA